MGAGPLPSSWGLPDAWPTLFSLWLHNNSLTGRGSLLFPCYSMLLAFLSQLPAARVISSQARHLSSATFACSVGRQHYAYAVADAFAYAGADAFAYKGADADVVVCAALNTRCAWACTCICLLVNLCNAVIAEARNQQTWQQTSASTPLATMATSLLINLLASACRHAAF